MFLMNPFPVIKVPRHIKILFDGLIDLKRMKFNFKKQKHILISNYFLVHYFQWNKKKILDEKQGIFELKIWFWAMCNIILNQWISKIVFSSIWFFLFENMYRNKKMWFIPTLYNFVRDQFNILGIDSILIFSNCSLLLLFRFICCWNIEKQLFFFASDSLFVVLIRG